MSPRDIDRVFGRDRLRMRTGAHVEVFRAAAGPGERRCYTKRFLATDAGDLREWTEREWRILARMVGHGIRCVPEVVQFDRGSGGQPPLVTTYDAGVTVDHWATLLPVERDARVLRNVFQDCAHWWALAHHLLSALEQVHGLGLIHLDLKADNVCIPLDAPDFRPERPGQVLRPQFAQLALIDFAFSLVAGEELGAPLPIGWQQEYDYQSPRLLGALRAGAGGDLQPTRELDWRCDMYSLAALLGRYLPPAAPHGDDDLASGWSGARRQQATALVHAIRASHDQDSPLQRPHAQLRALTAAVLAQDDIAASLARGWTLAVEASDAAAAATTPVTRLAPRLAAPAPAQERPLPAWRRAAARLAHGWRARPRLAAAALATALAAAVVALAPWDAPRGGAQAGAPAAARAQPSARLEARGRQLLSAHLPRAAAAAEKEVAWVLFLAATAASKADDQEVARAATRIPPAPDLPAAGADRAGAEQLHEQARRSLAAGKGARDALPLQLQAFGADPNGAAVAGQLALIHARLNPPQADTARQLATYAVARGRAGASPEHWATLAVASAQARREQDATLALFVVAALARNPAAACRLALDTASRHGERMAAPVAALLQRMRARADGAVPAECRPGAGRAP